MGFFGKKWGRFGSGGVLTWAVVNKTITDFHFD
jgi:hypothetical protein